MKREVIFSFVLFFILSLFYSNLCISQEHPLVNKKFGNIIFMKNTTTDIQSDYSNDTCYYLETTKNLIPEIWVRAFLKNNLQHYIDAMKKKHDKITYLNLLLAYTIIPIYYKDGKEVISQYGNKYSELKGEETYNLEKFTDLNVNTVQFKFSDIESFARQFSFTSETMPKNQTCLYKISCTLKFQCIYVSILDQTLTDFYKDEKGWEIMAIKSEEMNAGKYDYFKLLIK